MSRVQKFGFLALACVVVAAAVWYGREAFDNNLATPDLKSQQAPAQEDVPTNLAEGDAVCVLVSSEVGTRQVQGVVEDSAPQGQLPVALQSFVVKGRVRLMAEVDEPLKILCEARIGSKVRMAETIVVRDEGTFGPQKVPLLDADRFAFRLEGDGIVPEIVLVEPPGVDELLWVELEAKEGCDVWLQIVDPEQNVLAGAEAVIEWSADGVQLQRRARPRDDGYILLQGCPSGETVYPVGHCPGYRCIRLDPLQLPVDPPVTYVITLEPAALVRGRCKFQGDPVEEFEVVFWPSGFPYDKDVRSFENRKDGTFEIDSVPLGMVSFLASSSRYTHGEPKTFSVTQDSENYVELDLAEPIRGKGRVVAQESGEALPDALVLPYLSVDHAVAPWGPPRKVDPDGTFELAGFAGGLTTVRVSAPDCGTTWVQGQGIPGETLDFGLITLSRRQPLLVRLVSNAPLNPTAFAFNGRGPDVIAEMRFSDDGTLTVPSISAGHYWLYLSGENGYSVKRTATLEPGEDWYVEFPGPGFCKVRVHVVPESGQEMPSSHYVSYQRADVGGFLLRSMPLPKDGWVEFDGISPGEASFDVIDDQGSTVATSTLRIGQEEEESVCEIRLSGFSLDLRVLSASSEAIEGARVFVRPKGNLQTWALEYTNAEGRCMFRGLAPGPHTVSIKHQTCGFMQVPVTIWNSTDPIEVRMKGDHSVMVQLVEEIAPQPRLSTRLFDSDGWWDLGSTSSNTEGLAVWRNLSEGSYRVTIRHDAYWPSEYEVEAVKDDTPTLLQVYGLGSLEFYVSNSEGMEIANQPIGLTALTLESDVGIWLQKSLVTTSTGRIATDSRGRLTISGLPRGSYQWRLPSAEGLVVVRKNETSFAHIVVP